MKRNIRIGLLSMAIFQSLLLGLVGLLLGILYSVGGFFYDLLIEGSVNQGTALAFLALLGMPLIGICLGFFLGLVEAVLFNIFVGKKDGKVLNFNLNFWDISKKTSSSKFSE